MGRKSYEDTGVPVATSKEQIEKLLKGYSVVATRFTSFPAYAELAFVRKTGENLIPYRITVKPKVKPYPRNPAREMDQAERQVWRVVYWWLKAKLEAIDFGLVEFERELLPYMLVADRDGRSRTVAEALAERLAGRLGAPEDPFSGLRPALPEGKE